MWSSCIYSADACECEDNKLNVITDASVPDGQSRQSLRINYLSQVHWPDLFFNNSNFSYAPVASRHLPVEAKRPFNSVGQRGTVCHCLKTWRSLEKYYDLFLPPDAQRLWGGRQQRAGLGRAGRWRLKDQWNRLIDSYFEIYTASFGSSTPWRNWLLKSKRQAATHFLVFAWWNCWTAFPLFSSYTVNKTHSSYFLFSV